MSSKKQNDSDIEWKTEKRFIGDLTPHPRNPRSISKRSYKNLCTSLEKYNYVELATINLDNTILAGHQRIHVLQDLGRGDEEIEVRVPNRQLSNKEADNYLLVSNKVTGDFDYDILADQWEEEELIEGGFLKEEIYGSERDFEEEVEEKEFDESITDGLDINVKFIISIKNEIAHSFENQLETLLKKFPEAKMEKKL